ncbi:MAG: glycosyltransferase family 4 protein [Erysipelotrichaceae bacterium]|nr:glycosyltransferase family 4 protein [Erysipelotrichaceae bacterium]
MKILIVCQHYWPEPFRITDIAENLVRIGHDVTVLCGLPNYPGGYILNEYKKRKNRFQEHNGVKIVRVKEIGRRNNILFRFLNYWSFPHYASKKIKSLNDDYDVVYSQMSSPIMMTSPALKYAKISKKKVLMYEMDLWPESLLAGGIKSKSLIYKHYKKVSSNIYSRCDSILVSTKEHIDYIKALPGCGKCDITYLPQYADSIFEETHFETIENGVIDLMFAGNIGKAQSVQTIIKAASLLKNDSRFMFHIVGSGSDFENVKGLAKDLELNNVIFYGQKPVEEMPNIYRIADVMLVTLENKSYASMTIPGKMQTYMAVGKPVIGAISGSCNAFIKDNEIGFACEAEDYQGLADLILMLKETELRKIGLRSKEIYYEKYSKNIFMKKIIESLKKLSD